MSGIAAAGPLLIQNELGEFAELGPDTQAAVRANIGAVGTTGDISDATVTATGGNTPIKLADSAAFVFELASYGAVGDCQTVSGALTLPAGTNQILTCNNANFQASDVEKAISIPFAGAAGAGLLATIGALIGPTQVQLMAVSTTALTAIAFIANRTPLIANPGTGYVPREIVTLAGGTALQAAQVMVLTVEVVSAAVVSGGTGGTDGAVTITGTFIAGKTFQATGTISGGVLSGPLVITRNGSYSDIDQMDLSAEPITGGGLVGATVSVVMGGATVTYSGRASVAAVVTGAYSAVPANPVGQASSTGSGTGIAFTMAWSAPSVSYGTDDTAAINDAMTAAFAIPSTSRFGQHATICGESGKCYLITNSINFTQFNDVNFDGRMSVIHAATNGKPALDAAITQHSKIENLLIESDTALPMSIGIQWLPSAAFSTEKNVAFFVTVSGPVTLTGLYDYGAESLLLIGCRVECYGPGDYTTGGKCFIFTADNYFGVTSQFVSTPPQGHFVPFGAPCVLDCYFNDGASGSCAGWLDGGIANTLRSLNSYINAQQYGIVIYNTAAQAAFSSADFDFHMEGISSEYFMTGTYSDPIIQGWDINTTESAAARSILKVDTTITLAHIRAIKWRIGGGPFVLFDDATKWSVGGDIELDNIVGWVEPKFFSGRLNYNRIITQFSQDVVGDLQMTGALTANGINSAGGSIAAIQIQQGGQGRYPLGTWPTVIIPPPVSGVQATASVIAVLWEPSSDDIIVTPGAGFHVNDNLTVVGGTFSQAVVLTVLTVDANDGVLTFARASAGIYSAYPPPGASVTGGHGTGFTITLGQWGIPGPSYQNGIGGFQITDAGTAYMASVAPVFSPGIVQPIALTVPTVAFQAMPTFTLSGVPAIDASTETFTPSNGGTVTIGALCATAYVAPAGSIATVTIAAPPAITNPTGSTQKLQIIFKQPITATITWSGWGTVEGVALPTTVTAGASVTLFWMESDSKWLHTLGA